MGLYAILFEISKLTFTKPPPPPKSLLDRKLGKCNDSQYQSWAVLYTIVVVNLNFGILYTRVFVLVMLVLFNI